MFLYVTDGYHGLLVYDVHNMSNIVQIGGYEPQCQLGMANAISQVIVDKAQALADKPPEKKKYHETGKFRKNLKVLEQASMGLCTAAYTWIELSADQKTAYVAIGYDTCGMFVIFDVSNPYYPVLINEEYEPQYTNNWEFLDVHPTLPIIGLTDFACMTGVAFFDVSDPRNPIWVTGWEGQDTDLLQGRFSPDGNHFWVANNYYEAGLISFNTEFLATGIVYIDDYSSCMAYYYTGVTPTSNGNILYVTDHNCGEGLNIYYIPCTQTSCWMNNTMTINPVCFDQEVCLGCNLCFEPAGICQSETGINTMCMGDGSCQCNTASCLVKGFMKYNMDLPHA